MKRITNTAANAAKPADKLYKLSENGLQLCVYPNGKKRWRFDFRLHGKRNTLSLGVYPLISIADARRLADEARKQVANGIDPIKARKADKRKELLEVATTLNVVADAWLEKQRDDYIGEGKRQRTPETIEKLEWALNFARRKLGNRSVREIEPDEIVRLVLLPLSRADKREAAKRVRSALDRVFRYAIAMGWLKLNPAANLSETFAAPQVTPRPAITDRAGVGELCRAIDGYTGNFETRAALQLLMLTAVRPGELRAMEWAELDLDAAVWQIPASKMKMRTDHRVPFSTQALDHLHQMDGLTGGGRFVFPNIRTPDRCMSETAMNSALRRMGYSKHEVCPHGMRSTFSTLANESGQWRPEPIEASLAHKDSSVRGIYNRSDFWQERIRLMQWYADLLDGLRDGGEVIALHQAGGQS
jgi:integrase